MAKGARSKEGLTEAEIRERVNRVMENSRSYPDFAHLFDALMLANDNLQNKEFAELYAGATGMNTTNTFVNQIRKGIHPPTYQFVANVVNHQLLSLDPERIRPADQGHPAGEHRIGLFAAAGLIEVTPESVRDWNSEVLAGWQRWQERHPAGPKLSWKELMRKLLGFHMQGHRWTYGTIADAANAQEHYGCDLNRLRVVDLLSGGVVPTPGQREALAKVAGLDPCQVSLIEASIEDDSLPIHPEPSRATAAFATLFCDILSRLRASGISQRQLTLRTALTAGGDPEVAEVTVSSWKVGKARPTLESLRALIRGLEKCRTDAGLPLVTPETVCQLVEAAGFSVQQLATTTHDLIAHIDSTTRIKPLLWALRNAADLSVAKTAVDGIRGVPGITSGRLKLSQGLEHWESENEPVYPTEYQVRAVLARYNHLLQTNGQAVLDAAEIDKVVEVAERDRAAFLQQGFVERMQNHRGSSGRFPLSPEFDDGPGR